MVPSKKCHSRRLKSITHVKFLSFPYTLTQSDIILQCSTSRTILHVQFMLSQQASAFAENAYQGVLCLIPLGTLGRIMSKLRQVSWKRLGPAFAPWIHWSQDHAGKAPVAKICCHFWTVPRKLSLEMSPCSPTFGIRKPIVTPKEHIEKCNFQQDCSLAFCVRLVLPPKPFPLGAGWALPNGSSLEGEILWLPKGHEAWHRSFGNGVVLVAHAHHVARCYKPEIKSQGLHASANVGQTLPVPTCGLASWYHPFL